MKNSEKRDIGEKIHCFDRYYQQVLRDQYKLSWQIEKNLHNECPTAEFTLFVKFRPLYPPWLNCKVDKITHTTIRISRVPFASLFRRLFTFGENN